MIYVMRGGGATGYPVYTYTGQSQLINDGGKNWKIKFLTSGTLRFTKLGNAVNGIDVFVVGGGGGGGHGGGGGGYTNTSRGIVPSVGVDYPIVVGAGHAKITGDSANNHMKNQAGSSSAFGVAANGGYSGTNYDGSTTGKGGSGGSGGSGGATLWGLTSTAQVSGGVGGSNGSGGGAQNYAYGDHSNSEGQGTTTREFGEATGELYAGGGGCAVDASGKQSTAGGAGGGGGGGVDGSPLNNATPNTGGGGGLNGNGASGIVIIRNKR